MSNAILLLPMSATLSSSKTRHGGCHKSLSLHVGGFSLGWFDANGHRFGELHSLLTGHSAGNHGHSGSKWTFDPKHSWTGYNLDENASDQVMKSLFGTSVVDELNRHFAKKNWIIFKGRYCLPRENLPRFIASRCRDKTWSDAVWLKNAPVAVSKYVQSLAAGGDECDVFGDIRVVIPPSAPERERMKWRCEDCAHEGHREAFKERTIPGLSGSVGLDCPNCGYRKTDAITSLLSGMARGNVVRVASSILYPGG